MTDGEADDSEPTTSDGIAHLVRRIIDRLPQMTVPDFAEVDDGEETAWKLRALATPFCETDTSGRAEHGWPASGLTNDDMCKLRILSNLTGVPSTELLHVAVGLVFEQTRDATNYLLRDRETCESCLMAEADIRVSGAEPTAEASTVAASGSAEAPGQPVTSNPSARPQPCSSTEPSPKHESAEPVVVAESAPEPSTGKDKRQQELF